MEAIYHRQVLQRALDGRVSARALARMTAANLGQDSLRGQLHPEFHFDNSRFAEGLAYIENSREVALQASTPDAAWAAFGRLSHAAQDFYSHSNYVALWLGQFPPEGAPPPAAVDGLDPRFLRHPRLTSGRIYLPIEAMVYFPGLRGLVRRLLPKDSHAWMNLDSPATGPHFPYSIEAAVQRTGAEFDRTLAALGEGRGADAMRGFCDL